MHCSCRPVDKSVGKAACRGQKTAAIPQKSKIENKYLLNINCLYDEIRAKGVIALASADIGGLCISFVDSMAFPTGGFHVINLSCGAATLLGCLTRLPSMTGIWRRRTLPSQSGPGGVVHSTPFFCGRIPDQSRPRAAIDIGSPVPITR